MDQKSELTGNGGVTGVCSDEPVGGEMGDPSGGVRYAPEIGSGPLRESTSDPLIPVPVDEQRLLAAEAAEEGAERGVQLTTSAHEVPEFAAGTAHMVAMLAGEFPLSQLPEQALGETVGAAQALVQAAQSLLVVATHEAIDRGLPAQSGHSVPDWITTWAPRIDRAEALATARVAVAMDDDRFEALSAKVADGTARVARANVIVRMTQDLTPIATPESLQAVTDLMTHIVTSTGVSELSRIASEAKKQLVEPDDDEDEDNKQAGRRLMRKVGRVAGLSEWQLLLDAEGEAILSAALDPLSAPRPGADEHGVHQLDHRTAATRRADALLEIIGRGVAAPEGTTQTDKAKIVITVDHEALAGKVCGGGRTGIGEHLSAGTIRRLACDAEIIPMVLGGPSEALDVGQTKRLFTPAQRKAVLLRDKGCTFPGCSIPAGWTDIHHVVHWIFGGSPTCATRPLCAVGTTWWCTAMATPPPSLRQRSSGTCLGRPPRCWSIPDHPAPDPATERGHRHVRLRQIWPKGRSGGRANGIGR